MRLHINSSRLPKRELNNLSDVLRLSQTRPLCCVSAITDELQKQSIRTMQAATDELETRISDYNYVPIYGGWIEDNVETTELGFMVLGGDLCYSNTDAMQLFIDKMIKIGKDFGQHAVLIIDNIAAHTEYDTDNSPLGRAYFYSKFNRHPDIAYDEWEAQQQNVVRDLGAHPDTRLHELHGIYYDCNNGNITNEFNNVSDRQIGSFFTQFISNLDEKFTLLASTQICSKYVGSPFGDQYATPAIQRDSSRLWTFKSSKRFACHSHAINCALHYQPYMQQIQQITDLLNEYELYPDQEFAESTENINVSILWHKPSLNIGWHPIGQIDINDVMVFHREGSENPDYRHELVDDMMKFLLHE